MKRTLLALCATVGVISLLALAGCEWTSGGGVEAWDSSVSWVDFSGVYRNPNGGYIVTTFGGSSDSPTTNNAGSTNTVRELLEVASGVETFYHGRLSHKPVAGTLMIVAASYVFYDSKSDGSIDTATLTVNIADGTEGFINHATGEYSLRFAAPLAPNTKIDAQYQYLSSTVINPKGNHGNPIYTLTLFQQGNLLTMIDNNNATYSGSLSTVYRQGALADPPPTQDPNQQSTVLDGSIVAQFSVTGVSQGYNVTIVGTIEGLYSRQNYYDRTITGTYIEEGGYQADINAQAQRIDVSTNSSRIAVSAEPISLQ